MKHTVRENICVPYSLHDMSIPACTADGADLTLYTQSGLKQAAPPYGQPDGHVVFHRVQWDFSYVYLLETHREHWSLRRSEAVSTGFYP